MLAERDLEVPSTLDASVEEWKSRGAAVLYVIEDGRVTGAFSVDDEVRAESHRAVDELHQTGGDAPR